MSDSTPDVQALLDHADFVRGLARRLVLDESRADDLVQETWLAALQGRTPPRTPRAWLAGVVRNRARMLFRSDTRRTRHERVAARPEADSYPEDTAARMEIQERLVRAVAALEEPSRTAIVLRFLDGLPPRAIADRLGVPVRTIESRIRRGLERLRSRLDAEHEGDRRTWCAALAPLAIGKTAGHASVAAAGVAGITAKIVLAASASVLIGLGIWRLASPPTARPGGPGPVAEASAAPPETPESSEAPAPPEVEAPEIPVVEQEAPPPAAEEESTPPAEEELEPAVEPRRPPPDRPSRSESDPASIPSPPREIPPGALVPPGMAFVEGGPFEMGVSRKDLDRFFRGRSASRKELASHLALEAPAHEVTLAPFYMDRFEVTNSQWFTYLEAVHRKTFKVKAPLNTLAAIADELYGQADADWWQAIYVQNARKVNPKNENARNGVLAPAWATEKLPDDLVLVVYAVPIPTTWLSWIQRGILTEIGFPKKHGGQDLGEHPVGGVSLVQASGFAAWAGKHVPFEDEWEFCARGPKGFMRTWGGTWSKDDWRRKEDRLNWAEFPIHYPNHPARSEDPNILTTPVGSFPKGRSPLGMLDMLGNLWEWTSSPVRAYPGSKAPSQDWWPLARVVRGGSYMVSSDMLRTTFRLAGDGVNLVLRPEDAFDAVGFRCARWPVPGADGAYHAYRRLEAGERLPIEGGARRPVEFDLRGGIGVTEWRESTAKHPVYVTRAARSLGVLPRAVLPLGNQKDIDKAVARDQTNRGIVVALLQTSLALRVWVPAAQAGQPETVGTAKAGDYVLAYHGGRLQLLSPRLKGYDRIGYLCPMDKAGEFSVVSVRKAAGATSVIMQGFDRVDVLFEVGRRVGGKRFVFKATLHTAEKDAVRYGDWRDKQK